MNHFGPVNDPLVTDDFMFEDVSREKCAAIKCPNIRAHLMSSVKDNDQAKFLVICIPCYNETCDELMKTILSLLQNIEFMKRTKHSFFNRVIDNLHGDNPGDRLKDVFINTIPVLVPIFDGTKAMSPSMTEWMNRNFAGALDGMSAQQKSCDGQVEVRAACSKWWYFPGKIANGTSVTQIMIKDIIFFQMLPIIKRSNHRKHNSHEWFFNCVCESLTERVKVLFLTDCGTTFHYACTARLYYELYFKTNLIGVTASQKVETPNEYFHPCETIPICCLRGNHTTDRRPCWKCHLAFFLSPCPLQGFEFEATLIMNTAMFSLIEVLPVMPGPCQLLDWQKMKKNRVVDAYFNLLNCGESQPLLPQPKLPENMRPMDMARNRSNSTIEQGQFFTEFIRANMRLAEDRILSFVAVFCTGNGTKWIPHASFRYTPEVRWQTLLAQRRRWLNGTFASFLFFFNSARAKKMIWGNGKNRDPLYAGHIFIVNCLWILQIYQLALVMISPAIFGTASYVSISDCARVFPFAFWWATRPVYDHPVQDTLDETILKYGGGGAEVWLAGFFIIYAAWVMLSFCRAKIPELLCMCMAWIGFFFVVPIYLSIWVSIGRFGLNILNGMVIGSLLIPVAIALSQSWRSAVKYLVYLPWFLALMLFFLVYMPGYSFARLYDTTWGNRAGGSDNAITAKFERKMKICAFLFILTLILFNILATWGMILMISFGYQVKIIFMLVVFFPMAIQLVTSVVFLCITNPLRKITRSDPVSEKLTGVDQNNMDGVENTDMGKVGDTQGGDAEIDQAESEEKTVMHLNNATKMMDPTAHRKKHSNLQEQFRPRSHSLGSVDTTGTTDTVDLYAFKNNQAAKKQLQGGNYSRPGSMESGPPTAVSTLQKQSIPRHSPPPPPPPAEVMYMDPDESRAKKQKYSSIPDNEEVGESKYNYNEAPVFQPSPPASPPRQSRQYKQLQSRNDEDDGRGDFIV